MTENNLSRRGFVKTLSMLAISGVNTFAQSSALDFSVDEASGLSFLA